MSDARRQVKFLGFASIAATPPQSGFRQLSLYCLSSWEPPFVAAATPAAAAAPSSWAPWGGRLRTGILRKSSGFGVFAKIFSKNIVIPSKDIPFFGEAHQRFWAIIAKFGFFGVIRMARIAKFG
jgi:hypothetical protein